MPAEIARETLRVLVLGCGSIGLRHIRNLQSLGVREIVGFDVVEERREKARVELGIRVVDDLRDAWEASLRVAFITASTDMHVPLALEAARHACHLFIEKPLSHSFEGIDLLLAEVASRNLVTMAACNMRFHPGPSTIKRLLAEGAIGTIIGARIQAGSYLPGWRPWQDYRRSYSASTESGGAILDCIHEIDLALWYLGPARLLAAACVPAHSIGLTTDGLAELLIQHESGALTNIHLNFIQRDYRRTCQIIGAEGTLYWDFVEGQVRVLNRDGELARTIPEPKGWQLERVYLDEVEHFLTAVEENSATVNPLSAACAPLQIALSARERATVVV